MSTIPSESVEFILFVYNITYLLCNGPFLLNGSIFILCLYPDLYMITKSMGE